MSQENDRKLFDDAMRTFRAEITSVSAHLTWDAAVRALYAKKISGISTGLTRKVELGGKIAGRKATWIRAAKAANEMRNEHMNFIRRWSTPAGQAYAIRLKPEGLGLKDLIIKRFSEIHNNKYLTTKALATLPDVEKNRLYKAFERLHTADKNIIYLKIVESASTPRDLAFFKIDIKHWGTAGRGLFALSLALSVYNIVVAEDKAQAAAREASIAGAGIGGAILSGAATGAVAGTVCGPFAPACVAAGAFVGGALAAFGVSLLW